MLGVVRADMKAPDWFRDPTTGRSAAEVYAFGVPRRREGAVGIVNQAQEVNRLQHLTLPRVAWYLTCDDACAERVQAQPRWWRAAKGMLSSVNLTFRWAQQARIWEIPTADPLSRCSEHDGYSVLSPLVTHRRSVRFDPVQGTVEITDVIDRGPILGRYSAGLDERVPAMTVLAHGSCAPGTPLVTRLFFVRSESLLDSADSPQSISLWGSDAGSRGAPDVYAEAK